MKESRYNSLKDENHIIYELKEDNNKLINTISQLKHQIKQQQNQEKQQSYFTDGEKIINVDISNDKAEVEVEVTLPDLEELLGYALLSAFGDKDKSVYRQRKLDSLAV